MAKRMLAAASIMVLILTFGGAAAPSLAAPDPDRAMSFVRAGLDEVVAILEKEALSREEKIDELRDLLRRDFDLATVGKFALGVHRRGVNRAKLALYLQAFEDHVVEAYVERLVRLVGPAVARSASDSIKIVSTRPAGKDDILVRMDFERREDKPLEVNWRVRERKGQLKIIDVYFIGISLAMTYRQEFTSVISKRGEGIDGLISALREHATEIQLGGQ